MNHVHENLIKCTYSTMSISVAKKRMKLIKHKKSLIIGTIVTRNQNFGTSSNNLYKIKEDVGSRITSWH